MRKTTLACLVGCLMSLVAFAFVTLAQDTASKSEPPPLGKLIDVGGYRVHLYCTGSGSPPVVIVGAGFSFDWGLVQPEVAKFTQVCSYDHSGVGWSDDGPEDSCSLRVNEVHTALTNLGIKGPCVLVGHSLGGLVARVYAGKYPDETAGLVFVDHAFEMLSIPGPGVAPDIGGKFHPPRVETSPPPTAAAPTLLPGKPMGIEDDPNFGKLPSRDRELHLWFMAQSRNQKALQANHLIVPDCFAQASSIAKEQSQPLLDKPLVDVDTNQSAGAQLQKQLLALSRNSREMTADNSGHFVIVDRPDVVIDAISQAVRSARSKTPL